MIFRLVYNKAGCVKPFKRLWISSLEDSAIREGFNHLRDGKDYDRLYEACLLYTSLSAQEKKRIVVQKKKDRKAKKVHKSAQQTIPYVEMCRDGICKVNSRLYTKSIAFEDINYPVSYTHLDVYKRQIL